MSLISWLEFSWCLDKLYMLHNDITHAYFTVHTVLRCRDITTSNTEPPSKRTFSADFGKFVITNTLRLINIIKKTRRAFLEINKNRNLPVRHSLKRTTGSLVEVLLFTESGENVMEKISSPEIVIFYKCIVVFSKGIL